MTDEEILEIAHRTASTYAHRSDPTQHSYGFVKHTLLDFVRKLGRQAPDCRTCVSFTDSEVVGYRCQRHRNHFDKSLECTNGDKYRLSPAVVLWRTE